MMVKANGNSTNFEPTPSGPQIGICYGVIGIGSHEQEWQGVKNWKNQVVLLFELPFCTLEIDGITKPRAISRIYTLSLHEKALLRKHLESWRGKKFTQPELDQGFDLKNILGKVCTINVVHAEKGDKTYANIDTIVGAPDDKKDLTSFNEEIYFESDAGMLIPDTCPDWIKIKIFASKEMNGHSKDDEMYQQNHAPEEVAVRERVDEQMVNEEFGIPDDVEF